MIRLHSHRQSAFTLVELLVAITIAFVLTAVALPQIKEGLKKNASTRTASMVQTVFENARAQAIRTGRPFGVVLHRDDNHIIVDDSASDPVLSATHGANRCNRMSFVQQAFNYRGDVNTATGNFDFATSTLTIDAAVGGLLVASVPPNATIPEQERPVRLGTIVTLDGKYEYTVSNLDKLTSPLRVVATLKSRNGEVAGGRLRKDNSQSKFSFRTEVIPAPLSPVTMPGRGTIDLTCTGFTRSPIVAAARYLVDDQPRPVLNDISVDYKQALGVPSGLSLTDATLGDVVVMFNGSGQVKRMYTTLEATIGVNTYFRVFDFPLTGALTLLVGSTDGIVLPETMGIFPDRPSLVSVSEVPDTARYKVDPDVTPNFVNLDNVWLVISPSSGKSELVGVASPLPLGTVGNSPLVTAHPELDPTLTPNWGEYARARLTDSRRLVLAR